MPGISHAALPCALCVCIHSGENIYIWSIWNGGGRGGPVNLFWISRYCYGLGSLLIRYIFQIFFFFFFFYSDELFQKKKKKTILYSVYIYSRLFFDFPSGSIARIVHRRVGKLGQVSMADDGLLIPFQSRWRRANKTPSLVPPWIDELMPRHQSA